MVLVAKSIDPARQGLVGGKALNLARLERMGQQVPVWFVVPASDFRSALNSNPDLSKRISALGDVKAGELAAECDAIQQDVKAMPLGSVLRIDLESRLAALPADARVAVRSSALDEDGAGESFAGMHDSFLYVSGLEGIVTAVRRVWASAYNERAIAYRRERGLSIENIAVAVIVQEMVDARVSGVVFTTNPVNGNVHEMVISSVYGAGEGLVSEGLPADTFTVTKPDFTITADIVEKTEQLLRAPDGDGLHKVDVSDTQRDTWSLSEGQLRELAAAASDIERRYARPQDIEFSYDAQGKLHILQARPITTGEEYGPAAGHHLIWDNSNIIESYSGVTSPMTFSFIRRAYTIVYNCFCEVMGVPRSVVRGNQHVFSNMLGLFHGQVYYNLMNWYRLIRLFPGFAYNKQFMESMMGVKEPVELRDEVAPVSTLQRYCVELPRLLRLLCRSTLNFARIETLATRFQDNFDTHYARWDAMVFDEKQPHELMAIYDDMETRCLWNWKAPIINDFYVMIFYGILKKLCHAWCGDEKGSLQNDLICGEGDIESTQPTKMLLQMAKLAYDIPELKRRILEDPAEVLAVEIPADPAFETFNERMRNYLDKYGFRCMNELKLEEFSLRDKPQFVYTVLRNYLSLDKPEALDTSLMDAREADIRRRAEDTVAHALGGNIFRKWIFSWVLKSARLGVKNRENMRFARTKIYGLLRELMRAMGWHFVTEGVLDDQEQVFNLTVDEVFDYIKGTAVTVDLKALAALRAKEFSAYRENLDDMPDDRFDTYGMAYNRNHFKDAGLEDVDPGEGGLRGIGCCPGEVTGSVKVFRSPKPDMHLSGEILVAERTDPGWVPLYPSVSGVLIERGSILSHSAIVAREMGVPTIVGITGLVATLEDDQVVRMDGAAGTVDVVNEETNES